MKLQVGNEAINNHQGGQTITININLPARPVGEVQCNCAEMTLEQAEEKFGSEIIKKFLASHGVADIFSLEEVYEAFGELLLEKRADEKKQRAVDATRENQKKSIPVLIEKGKQNQALIIKLVLEGFNKLDIEYQYGFCRNTINKALKDLSEEKMNEIWDEYKDLIFEGVDRQLVDDFIDCDCDYKNYVRYLAWRRREANSVSDEV